MSGSLAPFWLEGMVMQPHHLQQLERSWAARLEGRVAGLGPAGWGLRAIAFDSSLLPLGRVSVVACQAVLPVMRSQGFGRIVSLIDVDADSLRAVPALTPYKIGKTGVLMLTRTLAVTEAPHGITVNGVSPGTLDNSERKPPLERIPAGRFGTAEEVARAVLFLADPASGYITGTNIKVSGGYLI